MPQTMTGKQALLEMLKAEGVEYIFGNPRDERRSDHRYVGRLSGV